MAIVADDRAARMRTSWERNAAAWTDAVRERRIASRRAGTDAAIVAAALRSRPESVLDVGCGEGWLARELAARGCRVTGIDASAALIASARHLGGGRFETIAYADIAHHAAALGAPFDVVVCNFSLLEEHLAPVLHALRGVLAVSGRLLIQSVHPWTANRDGPYADGWRTATFADFGDGFVEPMPWYFRTLSSWLELVDNAGFEIERVDEPLGEDGAHPLSLLIAARSRAA